MLNLAEIRLCEEYDHFMVCLPLSETRGHEVRAHIEYAPGEQDNADVSVWLQCDSVTEFERFLATVFQVEQSEPVQGIVKQLEQDMVFEENLKKLLDLIEVRRGK